MKKRYFVLVLLFAAINGFAQNASVQQEHPAPRWISSSQCQFNQPPSSALHVITTLDQSYFWPLGTESILFNINDIPNEMRHFFPSNPWGMIATSADFLLVENHCGDNYYDNGNLALRYSCDENGKNHGKSVRWDRAGRITETIYFWHGIMTKSVKFHENKIREIVLFKQKDNLTIKHGEHLIHHNSYTIRLNRNYGKYNGYQRLFQGEQLLSEIYFENGIRRDHKEWNDAGVLMKSYKWDEEEQLIDTLFYYDPAKDYFRYEYRNGRDLIKAELIRDGHVFERRIYAEPYDTVQNFNEEGTLIYQETWSRDAGFWRTVEQWDSESNLIGSYTNKVQDFRIVKPGFITVDSIRYEFTTFPNDGKIKYIEGYSFHGNDTISHFYTCPFVSYFPEYFLGTNHYVDNRRNGIWNCYERDKIVTSKTYKRGILHGDFTLFDTSKVEPQPFLHGYYNNGLRDSLWIVRTDSTFEEINFRNNEMNGWYQSGIRIADTIPKVRNGHTQENMPQLQREIHETMITHVKCAFENGVLHGRFFEFNADGSLLWEGQYTTGQKDGIWYKIDSKKECIARVIYDAGILIRSEVLIKKKNGKIKWKKDPLVKTPEYTIRSSVETIPLP